VPDPGRQDDDDQKQDWLKEVHKRKYENQKYLEERDRGEPVLYGLEAEAISSKRLTAKLEEVMVPLIAKSEDLVRAYELRRLSERIMKLALRKFKLVEKAAKKKSRR